MTEPATVLHCKTGTLLAVPDPWAVLEWLDRDGCPAEFAAEVAARDARWAEIQKRWHSAGAKTGERK